MNRLSVMAGITGRREGWKTLDCKPGADYTALVPPLPREVREQYLSKYYRVSNWAVEAERGFLHRTRQPFLGVGGVHIRRRCDWIAKIIKQNLIWPRGVL